MRLLTAIAALAVFLIVAEAPLREFLRAGRYRALRANLKPHAPPLNLSRVLEVAGAERCVGDGRCAGDELHDFAAAKGRMARVQAALNSPAKKDAQKYMSSENEVELAVPADATKRPSLPKTTPEAPPPIQRLMSSSIDSRSLALYFTHVHLCAIRPS